MTKINFVVSSQTNLKLAKCLNNETGGLDYTLLHLNKSDQKCHLKLKTYL